MQKLRFTITIKTPRPAIWAAITEDAKYRRWAAKFHVGTWFEGGWHQGDAIRFLAIDTAGKTQGMMSEIAESIYPSFISIRHIGQIKDGIEDTSSKEVLAWAPSFENYTIRQIDDHTSNLIIELEADESYEEMFNDLWPRALTVIRDICEAG
jgi:hypothetical protein